MNPPQIAQSAEAVLANGDSSVVQQRPSLGALPRARVSWAQGLAPGIDFLSSTVVLAAVLSQTGTSALPAIPLAPLLMVVVAWMLGIYGSERLAEISRTGHSGRSSLAARLLAAAAFAWSAGLLVSLSDGPGSLGVGSQLALWLAAFGLGSAARSVVAPLGRRARRPERWVVIGDPEISERLKAYQPLQAYARIVCSVPPPRSDSPRLERQEALAIVDGNGADRVVIAARNEDDEGLVALIKAFRSAGIPVSMMPRPLDLLEAPGATPRSVAGVPLIEVKSLAARRSTPYRGPDRRRDRRPRISVVVPALNEAENIAHVLERLPAGLHEVILVDGNSHDDTVKVATEARPDIRVLTQAGIGKGDALRTGFAAVTGNLVVMLDADGSADPGEIPRFVEALVDGADFAKGSRFLEGGGSSDITAVRQLGNSFLSATVNLLYGTHFTDLCYGYNAFWARCLPFISLDAPGFEVETLINLRIATAGMKISEVPSYETERISGQSNLKTFRDGFRVFFTIIRESPLRPKTGRHARRQTQDADVIALDRGPAHSRMTL